MNFNNRPNALPEVRLLGGVPRVFITPLALTKMWHYVDLCQDEIGWLGTAKKYGDAYLIEDCFLFEQEVDATNTDISGEGLAKFVNEMLVKGEEGIEIINNLKVWGHSHVFMDVSPSLTDNDTMSIFKENGNEWFLRIIANKKGDLEVSLFDYGKELYIRNVPWEVFVLTEDGLQERVDQEIKKKVKRKPSIIRYGRGFGDTFGFGYSESKESGDLIETYQDIFNYFEVDELFDIACAASLKTAKEIIEEYAGDFAEAFTEADIETIWEYAKQLERDYYSVYEEEDKNGLS